MDSKGRAAVLAYLLERRDGQSELEDNVDSPTKCVALAGGTSPYTSPSNSNGIKEASSFKSPATADHAMENVYSASPAFSSWFASEGRQELMQAEEKQRLIGDEQRAASKKNQLPVKALFKKLPNKRNRCRKPIAVAASDSTALVRFDDSDAFSRLSALSASLSEAQDATQKFGSTIQQVLSEEMPGSINEIVDVEEASVAKDAIGEYFHYDRMDASKKTRAIKRLLAKAGSSESEDAISEKIRELREKAHRALPVMELLLKTLVAKTDDVQSDGRNVFDESRRFAQEAKKHSAKTSDALSKACQVVDQFEAASHALTRIADGHQKVVQGKNSELVCFNAGGMQLSASVDRLGELFLKTLNANSDLAVTIKEQSSLSTLQAGMLSDAIQESKSERKGNAVLREKNGALNEELKATLKASCEYQVLLAQIRADLYGKSIALDKIKPELSAISEANAALSEQNAIQAATIERLTGQLAAKDLPTDRRGGVNTGGASVAGLTNMFGGTAKKK